MEAEVNGSDLPGGKEKSSPCSKIALAPPNGLELSKIYKNMRYLRRTSREKSS